jgi:hypothetical protein
MDDILGIGYGEVLAKRTGRMLDDVDEYVTFLKLKVARKDTGLADTQQLSPSAEIDAIWHQHILDTAAYARACQVLFDKPHQLIHHDPGRAEDQDAVAARYTATYMLLSPDSRHSIMWPVPKGLASLLDEAEKRGEKRGEKRARDKDEKKKDDDKDGEKPQEPVKKKARKDKKVVSDTFTVITLTSRNHTFSLSDVPTMGVLYYRLHNDYGYPADHVSLIFKGTRYTLRDNVDTDLVEEVGVQPGDKMHLVLNLSGC